MRQFLIAALLSLLASSAWAGSPVTINDKTNANAATVDSSGNLHVTSIGNVGGYSFQVAPTVTVQNAAYAAGNSEGGTIPVTGAARSNGGSGVLLSGTIRSAGGSTNTIWVYAWSKTPASTCTDKAAFVASASDNAFRIPGFPQQVTLGGAPGSWETATYAQLPTLNTAFKNQDSSAGTAIYLCFVTAGSVTPAATTDLSTVWSGLQD